MTIDETDAQHWRRAVEQGRFGVWDLDTRQDTVHYSPRWKVHLGFPYIRSADHTAFWRCRVHPEDQAQMLHAMRAHLAGQQSEYEAIFRLRSNGSGYRLMHSRGLVLERDARGDATRMVGTMADLSDRPASPAGQLLVEDAAAMPSLSLSTGRPFHQILQDRTLLSAARAGGAAAQPVLDQMAELLERSWRQVSTRS